MEPSTIVIKVKYGETLRRFNASIVDEKLVLDMEELRVKVLRLFNFAVDAELTLTYVDEDGDMVTLADEEDLQDVVRQSLNPLRITVRLNTERSGRMYSRSSGSSTPTRSPRVRHPLNASVSDILKSVPGPLREAASTLSKNLSLNSTSSPQALTELVDNLSRMGLTYLKQIAEFQAGTEPSTKSGASGSNLDLSENNDTKGSNVEVDPSPNANSKVPNLKDNQVLPKADLPALNSSELSTGRGVDVSAMLPPGSVDLNINLPNDHFSGMPYLSSDVNVPVGVKNKESKKSNECPLGGMSVGLGASGDSSGSHAGLNRVSKCPYAGTVVANDSAFPFPQLYAPHRAPLSDGAGSIFHRGVQCDGCGALPITGRRFKSKVKDDYDLCSICFAEQGNEADYIRMDRPLTFRKSLSSKGLYDPVQHCRVRPPMLPPHIFRGPGMKGGRHKLDSRFIQDVNILDGTIMGPSTPFTKIWRMKNNGTIVWPRGTHLMWIGGDRFSNNVSVELEIPTDGLPVEEELDIAIDFCAPELPGRYISYWRMALPSGQKFGQRVWVLIQVDASLRDSWHPTTRGFNLNLPPTSGLINGPQIVNVNVEPMVKNSPVEPEDSSRGTELVEPLLDAYPNKDQELNFPINDTLLVGGGASNPSPAEASSSSISYPVVDFSEVEPILHYTEPKPADMNVPAPVPAPAQREGGNNDVEQKLLRELEEMGFKQVDLNKEILRRNEYDLQQSVDDLCGVEEWDPILDDLKEMGFCNDEVNKRLLKKNNGSIKRVVMDLINGEKA